MKCTLLINHNGIFGDEFYKKMANGVYFQPKLKKNMVMLILAVERGDR